MQSPVKVWRRQNQDKLMLGLVGHIESWTTIFVAPPKFQHNTPYTVALVKLEDGSMVYGQLVDHGEKIEIGQKVKSVLRTNGSVEDEDLIEYGVKFKPLI